MTSAPRSSLELAPLPPTVHSRTPAASCSRRQSTPVKTCRRSRTPRWTGMRCAPRIPRGVGIAAGAPGTVVGELPAGHAPTVAVGAGEAIRIMTGAPMPPGADAIVMVRRAAATATSECACACRPCSAITCVPAGDVLAGRRSVQSVKLLTPRVSRAAREASASGEPPPSCDEAGGRALHRRRAAHRSGAARAGSDPRLEPADVAGAGVEGQCIPIDLGVRATTSLCSDQLPSSAAEDGTARYSRVVACQWVTYDVSKRCSSSWVCCAGTRWRSSPRSRWRSVSCGACRCSVFPATRSAPT